MRDDTITVEIIIRRLSGTVLGKNLCYADVPSDFKLTEPLVCESGGYKLLGWKWVPEVKP